MSHIPDEDITMEFTPGSSGSTGSNSITLDKDLVEKLFAALANNATTAKQHIKVHEPDLFHGERSSLAVNSWLSSLETYFELTKLNETEKCLYAVTLLRGGALLWWNRIRNEIVAPKDWVSFKSALSVEFKPFNSEQAARDKLAVLHQRSSVASYINEFRTLQLQIPDLSKGDALDRFIRGLKKNLRMAVRSRFPASLDAAESIALAIEGAAEELPVSSQVEGEVVVTKAASRPFVRAPPVGYQDDPMDLDTIRDALNAINANLNRRNRPAGMGDRRQIRCFGCQGFGHVKSECPTWRKSGGSQRDNRFGGNRKKHSLNSIASAGAQRQAGPSLGHLIDLETEDEDGNLSADQAHLMNLNNKESDLPLYEFFLYDNSDKRTVKVLLDTGASSNYISPRLVNSSMTVVPLSYSREVETAGGHVMTIDRKVEFQLVVQGLSYTVQAYIFDMKFDIILGQQWFRQARPVPDWGNSCWKLVAPGGIGEVVLTPCGDPRLAQAKGSGHDLAYVISKKQLQRYARKRLVEEVYLVHFTKPEQSTSERSAEADKLEKTILDEFHDVFRNDLPPGLPPVRVVEHVIDTGDANPINKPPFKMSPLELDELRRQLKELLTLGFIRPSSSPWGAPVLFVRKKDGTLRMCIDYRAVNALTRRLNTPLPRIDECLERLGGARYFSSIDLKSGYHQVRIKDEDVAKTAFNTRYGSYEFLVLPFGLTNSPPTFQKMMNAVLHDFIDKFVLVYLDDILIFSKTQEDHYKHLRLVMQRLRENKLYANPKKCVFNRSEVEFLGYRVSANGTLPSESKVKAVQEWPQPTNVQEVRQFVGLCSHYRRFIPGFSSVAAPLTDLTKGTGAKRRPIQWTDECQAAFDNLKNLMSSAPVLQHPDLDKPFVIETDASDYGIGAVLLQRDANDILHPIAFESKKLSLTEQGYPIQERELLAVLHSLRVWRCFVDGSQYVIYTDHNPLQYLRSQGKPTPRLVRWMSEIETYNPLIKYKPGKENGVPDALSRRGGCCIHTTSKVNIHG
ncbi:hypothetical protein G6F60_011646 [Rhizopus arrhizus]|nr:hypothetical protein G6F60_011646 [Rhizopus arrhizus]